VPIFAQTALHFTATKTGLLLIPGALASAVGMIVVGLLSKKVDARILIGIGGIMTRARSTLSHLLIPTPVRNNFSGR